MESWQLSTTTGSEITIQKADGNDDDNRKIEKKVLLVKNCFLPSLQMNETFQQPARWHDGKSSWYLSFVHRVSIWYMCGWMCVGIVMARSTYWWRLFWKKLTENYRNWLKTSRNWMKTSRIELRGIFREGFWDQPPPPLGNFF